jgi:hypothetical protein
MQEVPEPEAGRVCPHKNFGAGGLLTGITGVGWVLIKLVSKRLRAVEVEAMAEWLKHSRCTLRAGRAQINPHAALTSARKLSTSRRSRSDCSDRLAAAAKT